MNPLKLVILGSDKFSQVFGKLGKSIDHANHKIHDMHKGLEKAGAGLEIGGGLLTLGTGMEELPKVALEYEHGLAKIGVQSHITGKDLAELEELIQGTAKNTNQLIDSVEGTTSSLLKSGLSQEAVIGVLPTLGMLATATGESMTTLSQAVTAMNDQLHMTPEEMPKGLQALLSTSKEGKVTLGDMTASMAELLAQAKLLGMHGPGAISSIGAAAQMVGRGSKDSQSAIGNLEGYMRKLASRQMLSSLFKINPRIMHDYIKVLKTSKDPLIDLSNFLSKLTGGNTQKLAMLFGRDTGSIIALKQLTGGVADYQAARERAAHSDQEIQKDYSNMMNTTTEQWKNFKLQLETTAMPMLAGPMKGLLSTLQMVNHHTVAIKGVLFTIGGFLAGGAILIGLGQMAQSLSFIIGLFSKTATIATVAKLAIKGVSLAGKSISTAFAGFAPILGQIALAVGALVASVKLTDWVTKNFLGYKVGLSDLVTHGFDYGAALQDNQKDETRKTLREKYPQYNDEQIEDLVNHKHVTLPKEDKSKFLNGQGLGEALAAARGNGRQTVDMNVNFNNAPVGTRVNHKSSSKDISVSADLGYSFAGP